MPTLLVHVFGSRCWCGGQYGDKATVFIAKLFTDPNHGGIFALRAHYALLLDYVPPEEPPSKPLGNALRIRWPKLSSLKKVANYLPFT